MYGTILTFIKLNNFDTRRLNGPRHLFPSFCCTTWHLFEPLRVYEPSFNTDKYSMSVEYLWDTFHKRYIVLLKRYVPITVYSESSNVLQWMNNSVSRLIKRKCKAWLKYKSAFSHSNYLVYAKRRIASTEH